MSCHASVASLDGLVSRACLYSSSLATVPLTMHDRAQLRNSCLQRYFGDTSDGSALYQSWLDGMADRVASAFAAMKVYFWNDPTPLFRPESKSSLCCLGT